MMIKGPRSEAVLLFLAASLLACTVNASAQLDHPRHSAKIDRAHRREAHRSGARFTPADGGKTVHDNILHVTWLADADYPAKHKFGLPVSDNGAMTYETAKDWLEKLRKSDGPLGHKHWQLPMTPPRDASCNTTGPKPLYNKFGYGCVNSAMGSLFYDKDALALSTYETAVPITRASFGGFNNIQPYLYWTSTGGNNKSATAPGYVTFSFATGWAGSNVYQHVMYVLPMLAGNPFGASTGSGKLVPVKNGEALYDDNTKITWAADANLAARSEFRVSGVNADGSMMQPKNNKPDPATLGAFLYALNHHGPKGYLGQSQWQLPPASLGSGLPCGGFNCNAGPLGELFYKQFHLAKGESPVTRPDVSAGPFHDLQPYLYWSCQGVKGKPTCNDKSPGTNFAWSFSFGNGFEGTDLVSNELYVTAYYPDETGGKPPGPVPHPPPVPHCPPGITCPKPT